MDIQSLIRKKAQEAGIDPTHALTMASIESGYDPKAANKHGYKGLYQFGPAEWKQWGGGKDVFDPEANIDAYIGYQGEINNRLKSALGRDPTPQEQYLGWQQGGAGASKLITNRDAPAKSLVSPDAILANGGSFDMSGGEYTDLWRNKYDAHNKKVLGQSQGWSGEGDTQESRWIGAPAGGGLLAQPQAAQPTAGQEIDPVYGSVVKPGGNALGTDPSKPNSGLPGNGGAYFPATPAKEFNNAGLISSGLQLMKAGEAPPPQQASWIGRGAPAQAHRGDQQLAGLLTDLMKKKPFGGLLGEF